MPKGKMPEMEKKSNSMARSRGIQRNETNYYCNLKKKLEFTNINEKIDSVQVYQKYVES